MTTRFMPLDPLCMQQIQDALNTEPANARRRELHAAVCLLSFTGMRLSELRDLPWDDVHLFTNGMEQNLSGGVDDLLEELSH